MKTKSGIAEILIVTSDEGGFAPYQYSTQFYKDPLASAVRSRTKKSRLKNKFWSGKQCLELDSACMNRAGPEILRTCYNVYEKKNGSLKKNLKTYIYVIFFKNFEGLYYKCFLTHGQDRPCTWSVNKYKRYSLKIFNVSRQGELHSCIENMWYHLTD